MHEKESESPNEELGADVLQKPFWALSAKDLLSSSADLKKKKGEHGRDPRNNRKELQNRVRDVFCFMEFRNEVCGGNVNEPAGGDRQYPQDHLISSRANSKSNDCA